MIAPTTRRSRKSHRAAHVPAAIALAALTATLLPGTPAAAAATPTADIQAGARTAPNTAWLAAVHPCNRYVSTSGADTASGTTVATAWRTIGKAMRTLTAGQTACVRAGTYNASQLHPATSGTASAPIGVRGYPGDPKPLIRATTDASLFDFQTSGGQLGYWLVDGFDIDKQRHDGASVRIEGDRTAAGDSTLAGHIAVTNNRIRYSRSGAAILVRNRATDILIRGNEISDHHRFEYRKNYGQPTQQLLRSDYVDAGLPTTVTASDGTTYSYGRADAHGVSVESDSRYTTAPSVERVRVRGNRLLRNGGDGLQCIGANDSGFAPLASDAADIDLVDNRMEANVEEGADIKSCQHVGIRGSISPANPTATKAADNKMLTSRPTNPNRDLQFPRGGGNFGGGDLIVLHYAARHILIENTRLWNACHGISIGRDETPVQHVIIRRVLVFGMANPQDSSCARDHSTGTAVEITRAQHVDIYNNTFDMPSSSANAALSIGSSLTPPPGAAAPYLDDIDVWNNIIRAPRWANVVLSLSGTRWTSDFRSERNLYQRPGVTPPADGFILSLTPNYQFDPVTLPTWRSATGGDTTTTEADPRFVPDPITNDYYTSPNSPARDTALRIGPSVPPCPGAITNPPDRGFRETC